MLKEISVELNLQLERKGKSFVEVELQILLNLCNLLNLDFDITEAEHAHCLKDLVQLQGARKDILGEFNIKVRHDWSVIGAKNMILRDVLHDFRWLVGKIASEENAVREAWRLVLLVDIALVVVPVPFVGGLEVDGRLNKEGISAKLSFGLLQLLLFLNKLAELVDLLDVGLIGASHSVVEVSHDYLKVSENLRIQLGHSKPEALEQLRQHRVSLYEVLR